MHLVVSFLSESAMQGGLTRMRLVSFSNNLYLESATATLCMSSGSKAGEHIA
nr:hypothetical protein Iba_chr11cCG7360 [Ipomoea batatas]